MSGPDARRPGRPWPPENAEATLAALKARLVPLSEEELAALADTYAREEYDGHEFDEDGFREWVQEEYLDALWPGYKAVREMQQSRGWPDAF